MTASRRARDGGVMGKFSRDKGARVEREIAREIYRLTGVHLFRDLEQVRKEDRGDLVSDDPLFPFLIEVKARANGGFQASWWAQAEKAAEAAGKMPAVVYRFDRQPPRVRVRLADAVACLADCGATEDHMIDISLDGFGYLISEAMENRGTRDETRGEEND